MVNLTRKGQIDSIRFISVKHRLKVWHVIYFTKYSLSHCVEFWPFPWVQVQRLLKKDLLFPKNMLIALCLFLGDVQFLLTQSEVARSLLCACLRSWQYILTKPDRWIMSPHYLRLRWKLNLLSDQQFKTLKYLIYKDIKQKKLQSLTYQRLVTPI